MILFWSIRWTPQPSTGQELSPHPPRRPWESEPWVCGRLGVCVGGQTLYQKGISEEAHGDTGVEDMEGDALTLAAF